MRPPGLLTAPSPQEPAGRTLQCTRKPEQQHLVLGTDSGLQAWPGGGPHACPSSRRGRLRGEQERASQVGPGSL